MPKRLCPFECDLTPQHKIHISEKEMCHGNRLKSVYDKTLKLLFMGAKKVANVQECEATVQLHSSTLSHTYKQMFLDSQCRLQSAGNIKPQVLHHCESCGQQPICNTQTRCTFCEKILCSVCGVTCFKCGDEFCRSCSLAMYSDTEDEILCLNCCR